MLQRGVYAKGLNGERALLTCELFVSMCRKIEYQKNEMLKSFQNVKRRVLMGGNVSVFHIK